MKRDVRVLGINGSPRRQGNTYKLLTVALRAAELEGAKVKALHIYDYDIKPCTGCLSDDIKSCKYPCVIEDDMKKLYEEVLKADGIIISSPVYWFSVPGQLKNFIDRLTVFENMIYIDGRCWTEGKVAGVIAAGADSGQVQLISVLFATLNSMGFIIPPWALAYTVGEDAMKQENTLADAANVGRAVALMAKLIDRDIEWYDPSLKGRLLKRPEVKKA